MSSLSERVTYLEETLIPWYELRAINSETRVARIREITLLKREYYLLTGKEYRAGKKNVVMNPSDN